MKRLSWQHLSKSPGRVIASPSPRPASMVPPVDRLYAKDLAALEKCSVRTARRMMAAGDLGAIHGRNTRDRWIDRRSYQRWLDARASSQAAARRFSETI